MEWISVEDRLPEEGAYLTFNSFRCCCEIILFHKGAWATQNRKDITHWMPLPKPPKED